MPEDEFKIRSAVWWLSKTFGDRLQSDRKRTEDAARKAAQERKWWFIHAARVVLEQEFGSAFTKQLIPYFRGEWKFGEKHAGKWFDAIYKRSHAAVLMAYQQAAKQPGFVHRNWMRNVKSVDEVRSAVETITEVAEPLPIP
jgi:hypothetical protein